MPEIEARTVKKAVRSYSADHGKMVIVTLLEEANTELNVAIPLPQVRSLIEASAKGMEDARKDSGLAPNMTFRLMATKCETAFDQAEKAFVLTMTFGAGAPLSFQLGHGMAEQLAETLSILTGRTPPPKSDSAAH